MLTFQSIYTLKCLILVPRVDFQVTSVIYSFHEMYVNAVDNTGTHTIPRSSSRLCLELRLVSSLTKNWFQFVKAFVPM